MDMLVLFDHLVEMPHLCYSGQDVGSYSKLYSRYAYKAATASLFVSLHFCFYKCLKLR